MRDDVETAKLARFGGELQGLEDRLPIDPRYRRKQLGGLAPMRVVNVVFSAGDGNHDVQTAAYNLPNDERIVNEMGSKRMMLKNFQQAKFDKALLPISKVALAAADQPYVNFDAFFTHILMHEVMHGLGPQNTGPGGTGAGVRQAIKELYSTIEEAKADVSGLWALQKLMDKGVLNKADERAMYTTFLASSFRTLRFGMTDSHARGMAMQVNYLLDAGGFRVNADGTFSVNLKRAKKGVVGLTHELMTLGGDRRLRGREALPRSPGRDPPRSEGRARPPRRRAGGHPPALHHGGRSRARISLTRPPRACQGLVRLFAGMAMRVTCRQCTSLHGPDWS